jgi:hypothetical protein
MKTKETNKRNLFADLMEGIDAMKQHREGKQALLTHRLSPVAGKFENSPCVTLSPSTT